MKKLLMMILMLGMLGMSGTVWAVEVKLLCEANGHSEIVRFDEEARTVNGRHLVRGQVELSDHHISEHRESSLIIIYRYDGKFEYGPTGQSSFDVGTCTQATQKF